ncbi:MAG: hypothetical protein ACLUNQ_09330 [Oscillospiraceae bacterium]
MVNKLEQSSQAQFEAEAYKTKLINKYVASPITAEVLDVILNANRDKPTEIEVHYNCVVSRLDDMIRTYDFLKNQVTFFETKYFNDGLCTKAVYQSEALAEAINQILGGSYSIDHKIEADQMVFVLRLEPYRAF